MLAYGSCHKFTATHMQELLSGLVETWTYSEKLMARGCILGVDTDADSRHFLAQQLSILLGFKMGLLLVGVDVDIPPWGGSIYDPSHLLKRVRTLVPLHGMVPELGHPINGDTLRVLGNAAGVQFPNQSMFDPKDKQHVEYALQLLRCVTRVGVALLKILQKSWRVSTQLDSPRLHFSWSMLWLLRSGGFSYDHSAIHQDAGTAAHVELQQFWDQVYHHCLVRTSAIQFSRCPVRDMVDANEHTRGQFLRHVARVATQ